MIETLIRGIEFSLYVFTVKQKTPLIRYIFSYILYHV